MNINEDKFANKSAEEIIDDMLSQHKNNSKEALEHMQDILKDDGLTLGDDAKANLKKAVDILSDKGLKEGWFSKPAPKYAVTFEVYLPFKKEPAQFQIPPVSSLNDPLVKDAVAKIRKRHPRSTIYIRSELGDQKITEEKEPKKGGFVKALLSNDITKNLAATALAGVTGISPIFTKTLTNGMLKATADKFESTKEYQVNLYTENTQYTCYVGSLGIALTLAEKSSEYSKVDVLKENNIICSYDRSLKEWSTNDIKNTLKEDIYSDDDIEAHSYVDLKQDLANIDERAKLIQCHLNPNLIDSRKPKFHNIFGRKEYVEIPGLNNKESGEVLVVLDGIDQEVNEQDPKQTEVTLLKKIPVSVTDNGTPVYRNGEKFVVTVNQFIKLLNDPENAGILEKFEKSKDPAVLSDIEAEEFAELDKYAKEILDSKYPEWEAAHEEEYNLDNYTLPERAEIYKAWKDRNRSNMYQQARELTPEEVNKQFGFKKLKNQLKNQKDGAKLMTAYDSVRRAIPENDQINLDNKLLDILNNDESINPNEIRQIIGYYGAKNQLNQLSKGKLVKVANDLPEDVKAEFDSELAEIIKTKYLDPSTSLPKVVQNSKEAIKDITELLTKFTKDTNSSVWNQKVDTVKEVGNTVTEILNIIKDIKAVNPDKANDIKNELIGAKNSWRAQHILGEDLLNKLDEFLQYTNKVKADELQKSAEIASINAKYSDPSQADIRNQEIDKIKNKAAIKSDQQIAHEAWFDMIKSIANPKSDAEDPSYYTAITNKISRLVKTDPQAAQGYHKEFQKLLDTLEAENATKEEAEVKLVQFLDTMKDETKGYGTTSKALNAVIVNNGEL